MYKLIVLLFVLHITYPKSAISIPESVYTIIPAQSDRSNICCDAQIMIESIEDSRCPLNVQCIWAGQAKVQIAVSKAEMSSTAELVIGANPQNNAIVTVGTNQYSITLEKVIPYHGDGQTGEQKEAVLQVECL
ncbi:unnamed protein product [Adineta ricciae]|uniref:Uncharacterized protein n=1 Tax=Adineta ricciae TaxID=249248 RepID=A0A815SRT6_ADIRI|nr:unnamed protein product [Adineta ricciae]CAF1524560.1 unnamed protein product [Adineta ricciae]